MNLEQANRERDRRLRRLLLTALDGAKRHGIRGDLDGITLRDVAQAGLPDAQAFEDELHCIGLIRDLVGKSFAAEEVVNLRRGQRVGLAHLRVRITDRGSMLLRESIEPDPDIDDERVSE